MQHVGWPTTACAREPGLGGWPEPDSWPVTSVQRRLGSRSPAFASSTFSATISARGSSFSLSFNALHAVKRVGHGIYELGRERPSRRSGGRPSVGSISTTARVRKRTGSRSPLAASLRMRVAKSDFVNRALCSGDSRCQASSRTLRISPIVWGSNEPPSEVFTVSSKLATRARKQSPPHSIPCLCATGHTD
jgi:hypothetical protein